MKITFRMIGISIILWFGLGIGLAHAATPIATSNGGETDTTETSESGLALFHVNYTSVDLFDYTVATAATTRTASFSDTAEPRPAETAAMQPLDSMRKAADRAVDAGSSAQISTHQTYAMLLVGLGMLFFSERQRSKVA
jgi:hypothetical protein